MVKVLVLSWSIVVVDMETGDILSTHGLSSWGEARAQAEAAEWNA